MNKILYVALLCVLATITAAADNDVISNAVDQAVDAIEGSDTLGEVEDEISKVVNQAVEDPDTLEEVEDELTHFLGEVEDEITTSKNKFLLALFNLSSYLPLNVEYATTVGPECDVTQYNKDYYSRTGVIIASVMFILGIVFCFFGYRLMRVVLFLIGFFAGGAVTYFIVLAFTYELDETWVPYVAFTSAVTVGIFLGVLAICVYYIGIFLAGAGIGFLIAWFILAAIDIQFFQMHIWVPFAIAAVVSIVLGVIGLFFQKWFFILGTSVLGAFKIVWGLDYFVELGAMIYYLFLFAEHRTELKLCWYSWCVIPLFIVLALVGLLIQAALTGRKYDHRRDLKGVCCGAFQKDRKTKEVDEGGEYMDLKLIQKEIDPEVDVIKMKE